MQNHVKKNIKVDNQLGNSNGEDYSDLNNAVNSSIENTRIHIGEGIYIVDNPIKLIHKGMKIIGNGKDKTILMPKNVGKPIFRLEADYLSIESLGINAEIQEGFGRATFAIFIEEGHGNCEIKNNKIQNTGASSIIGHLANDCIVDNNIIINSGDDAIQMRGTRLKILNNILLRYFDEGIDVAGGENIIVSNNISSSGRIGIVVDGSKNAYIYGNIVEDHLEEGIVLGSEKGGVVENNFVNNSNRIAFNLQSPLIVKSNIIAGKNYLGLKIREMQRGIIQRNVIMNTEVGIIISGSVRNIIHSNEYFGKGQFIKLENDSIDNYLYGNITNRSHKVSSEKEYAKNKIFYGAVSQSRLFCEHDELYIEYKNMVKLLPQINNTYHLKIKNNILDNIAINGESMQDKAYAENIAKIFGKINPGYLSIRIQGNSMRSDITQDLYNSLKGGGQLAVGLVRAPYLEFSQRNGSYFPLWHLFLGKNEVAMVSRTMTGANVQIYIFENGGIGLKNMVSMWKNRLISGIYFIKNKILNKFKTKFPNYTLSWQM